MKRFVSVMLCISLMASLVSCGKTPTKESSSSSSEDSTRETEESEETTETSSDAVTGDPVIFSTVDRDGNTYDESIFSDYELTVINFWEPWCGPCVGEMPDLEELYENYSDQGLLIIGVYSEENMEGDVEAVLSDSGITYPILRYTSEFDQYQSGYVPTTILVDSNGNIIDTGEAYLEGLDSTLIVGSHSYGEWEDIVEQYLGA
ncbi:MAG: TlpA family protein disulfide reductase [Saccharofermentans sp.]|nr:TlpA family protein disulfide reductase [Saccharofermentans sp.]